MNLWSLPSRERGLKFDELCLQYELDDVAPLAGAWIEIAHEEHVYCPEYSRSPRGSVD